MSYFLNRILAYKESNMALNPDARTASFTSSLRLRGRRLALRYAL